MTVFVTFILICAGLSGIHSVKTVGHIMMEAGGTVHIPCQYETHYIDNVKYLCRGATWASCKYQICSNHPDSPKYSINDDKTQRIVTFTVKSLEVMDSDTYWCNIEKTGTDDGKNFQLSITTKGESKLSVDSQLVSGYFDGQVTIKCKYNGPGEKTWCKVDGTCTSGDTKVSIDTHVAGVFAVTMTGLQTQDIGWYWCGLGNLQMPVFLSLATRPTTTTIATTTTMSTVETESTPVFSTHQPGNKSISIYITAAVIALGVLILIIIVLLFTWCKLKRKAKKTEGESPSSPECVDYPVYGNVTRPTSHQNTGAAKDVEVLYNSVSFKKQTLKQAAVKEEDVTYSTLAKQS
ncbi:hypothetical protein NQD34_010950 [Periophthalmus magnuspinnatus]|uniref:CMRF35-like molecule 1 n=1 Tax=Periophthalmus magnuspinnatus TaxID=409849 RepID=UPI0022C5EB74|nr:CMRF35-like molecule 1 [Periophthalmus magnuspinnatus]KAJ0004736.1 hypothetical protein NQD34_010950 [Periophthalmus magnuspinnatus]